jgi:5'-nucleotidase (lipoprotein e(P4) family)
MSSENVGRSFRRYWKFPLLTLGIIVASLGHAGAQDLKPEADYRYGSVTWMQKSAEYRLLTEQTYRYALVQLISGIHDRKWSADEHQLSAGGFEEKPPAVILDLDETVLDNSYYNARNILLGRGFSLENWNQWCNEGKATAIPGAFDFVKSAEGLGVKIYYLTNREDTVKAATIKNLNDLGFKADENNVLTKNEEAGRGDDKLTRRAAVASKHRVVLLIGDSMSDLCEGMDVANTNRRNEVARGKSQLFGTRWIMLPNPSYGGWQRALPAGAKALETRESK